MQFRRKDFLAEQMKHWIAGRESGLLRLCLEPNRPMSPEELSAWFGSDRDALKAMLTEGWLFQTTRLGGGRTLFFIPDDLREKIARRLVSDLLANVRMSATGPLVYAEETDMLLTDLDSFLQYASNHALTLTQDGALYKRHLEKIVALMQVQEELLGGGWRFGYGRRFHDYPDRFAFIYDFAYAEGLVAEPADAVLRVEPVWDEWNQMGRLKRQRKMVSFYLSHYRRAIRRLPVIVQLLAQTKVWVNSSDMFTAIDGLINEYYYDTKENVWQVRILKMLRHLGIVRVGTDEFGEEWFQITKLGQQLLAQDVSEQMMPERAKTQVLIVQPNFDIVITQDAPQITAELALFADLRQSGALRIYRLSTSSASRALEAGKTPEDMLAFLARHSQTPIPGNVERTILSWQPPTPQEDTIPS